MVSWKHSQFLYGIAVLLGACVMTVLCRLERRYVFLI